MLNFGKYKGKTLEEVLSFDIPYVTWMANNVVNIDAKLDKEDQDTLFKYAFPYKYIENKYGYFITSPYGHKRSEEEIIKILQDEGFVTYANSYIDPNECLGVEGEVKTFYGSTFGSTWGCGNIDATHFDLIGAICGHLDKAQDWFKDYIAKKRRLIPNK